MEGLGIGDDVVLLEEGGQVLAPGAGAAQQHLVRGGEVECGIAFEDQTLIAQRARECLGIGDSRGGDRCP